MSHPLPAPINYGGLTPAERAALEAELLLSNWSVELCRSADELEAGARLTVNKLTHELIYENETEESVTVSIVPKAQRKTSEWPARGGKGDDDLE